MRVLAHPDPFALEEELLAGVRHARAGDPLTPVLVLVPTVRLAAHVQRRLGERLGACLGVEVLHHRALVLRILDAHPGRAIRPASARLREALLGRVLQGLPDNSWTGFVRSRPGTLPALLRALETLREAGIPPAEARPHLRGGRHADLAEVHGSYCETLAAGRERGLTDEAGLVEAALPEAAAHAARYAAVFHHGAYELIGVHLDLIRAMDRGAPLTFLLPAQAGAPAYAYAERFARRHLLRDGERIVRIERPAGARLAGRLADLYVEEARPRPLDAGALQLRHAQGPHGEVTAAVRAALAATGEDVPPMEVALVARTLTPYGAALEEAMERPPSEPGGPPGRIPWTTSLGTPLRREPEVRELMLLLRTAAEDFPRATTAELLRSRRLRWNAIVDGGVPGRGEKVESWSRKAGLVGGLAEWTEDLPAWAQVPRHPREATAEERREATGAARRRHADARQIGRALERLSRRIGAATSRTWSRHADAIEEIVQEILPGLRGAAPGPALDALLGLLEEMRGLETRVGDDRSVPFAEMVEWLERAVDGTELRPLPDDDGGLRVLDVMQARGLTFRRLLLFGFQSGLFPRTPREDPILPDDARLRLREATGRPLPVKSEGDDEERLLLALTLGSAAERIEILWQRSDGQGRPRTPSLALREVARLVLGTPDMEALIERARRVRSHPKDTLEDLVEQFGLIAPEEETLLLALRSAGDPEVEKLLLERSPALRPGLRMMRYTESLAPRGMEYDGRVAPLDDLGTLGVTALEVLGACPLKFLFRERLRVIDLEEEVGPFELAAREMGNRVHRLLELLYAQLQEEGLFEAAELDPLHRRARELLDRRWADAMGDLAERFARRTPLLWRIEEDRWRRAIESFLETDLERLIAREWRPRGFEEQRDEGLRLGPGINVRVRGRFDRILSGAEGSVIGDYKTSGNLRRRVSVTEMLKGHTLQVPLYHLLGADTASVELLGVGPDFAPGGPRAEADERHVEFGGFQEEEQRRGFQETLRVLLGSAARGRYPLLPDERRCSWCDYRRACRRNHPPSRHREEVAKDAVQVHRIQKKQARQPLLPPRDAGDA